MKTCFYETGSEAQNRTRLSSVLPRRRHIRALAQISYPGCLLGRSMCWGWLARLGIGWFCGNVVQGGTAKRSTSRLAVDKGGEVIVFCLCIGIGRGPNFGTVAWSQTVCCISASRGIRSKSDPQNGAVFWNEMPHRLYPKTVRSACKGAGVSGFVAGFSCSGRRASTALGNESIIEKCNIRGDVS